MCDYGLQTGGLLANLFCRTTDSASGCKHPTARMHNCTHTRAHTLAHIKLIRSDCDPAKRHIVYGKINLAKALQGLASSVCPPKSTQRMQQHKPTESVESQQQPGPNVLIWSLEFGNAHLDMSIFVGTGMRNKQSEQHSYVNPSHHELI